MEQNLFIIISVLLFLPQAVHKTLGFSYWWQIKEYRFDRLMVFLKTNEGREIFFPLIFFLKLIIVVAGLFNSLAFILLLPIFLAEDIRAWWQLLARQWRRPVLTVRAVELIATSIGVIGVGVGAAFLSGKLLPLALADIGLVIAAPMAVIWTAPLVWLVKVKMVGQARKRLRQVNPVVVGITGSYGKTSTKEFIATVLSVSYKVSKTDASHNTEFGIARKILGDLPAKTQILVVEMGAYRRGEIKILCNFVYPSIGVLTAVGNQHLALFASQKNILATKMELINSLPNDGTAIFNGDNRWCLAQARRQKRKTIVYTTHPLPAIKGKGRELVYGSEISVGKDHLSFTLGISGKKIPVTVPLLGAHFVQNLLAAAAVGQALAMNITDIGRGLAKVGPVARTMESKVGPQGSLVVDDSYSTSVDGFEAAVNWARQVRAGRKIVITAGIIELGDEADAAHEKIGQLLAEVADLILLTNKEFILPLCQGLGSHANRLCLADDGMFDQFCNNLTKEDIVIIEGRIPEAWRKRLIVTPIS